MSDQAKIDRLSAYASKIEALVMLSADVNDQIHTDWDLWRLDMGLEPGDLPRIQELDDRELVQEIRDYVSQYVDDVRHFEDRRSSTELAQAIIRTVRRFDEGRGVL